MNEFLDRFAKQWREQTDDSQRKTPPTGPFNPFSQFDGYDQNTPLTEVEETARQGDATLPGGEEQASFETFQTGDIVERTEQEQTGEPELGPFEPGEVQTLSEAFEKGGSDFTLGQALESAGRLTPKEEKEWATDTREEAESLKQAWNGRLKELKRERQEEYVDKQKEVPAWLDWYTGYAERQIKEAQARTDDVDAGRTATKTALRDGIERSAQSMGDMVGTAFRGIATGASMVGDLSGYEFDPKDTGLHELGQKISDYAKEEFPGDPARQREFGAKIGHGVGSLLGLYGPAAIPKLLKMGTPGMVAAVSSVAIPSMGQYQLEEAEWYSQRSGEELSDSERQAVYGFGAALGGLETLPFANLLRVAGRAGPGPAGILQSAVKQAEVEGLQEGFSQIFSNVIARNYYDPERDPFSGALEGAAIGYMLGFPMGGAAGTFNALRVPPDQAQPEAETPDRAAEPRSEGEEITTEDILSEVDEATQDITAEDVGEAVEQVDQAVQDGTTDQLVEDVATEIERMEAEGELPAFEDMLDILPEDDAGDPDVTGLQRFISSEYGKDAWNELSDNEKRTAYNTFAGEETYPLAEEAGETAVEPEPEQTGAGMPERPVTVITFIRGLGGIKPTPELRGMDAHRIAGFVNREGMDVDRVREALVEEGFLQETGPDQPAATTPQDVYDLIDRALRGERVVREADSQAEQVWQDREDERAWRDALMGELETLDQDVPGIGFMQQYQDLDESDRGELLARFSEGEPVDSVLEDIAIRRYNDPPAATVEQRRTLNSDPIGGEGEADATRAGQARAGPGARGAPGVQPRGQRGSQEDRADVPAAGAAPDEVSLRERFVRVLEGRTPRRDWAQALGITPAELDPLIAEQIAQGRLRRTRDGKVWRTPRSSWPREPEDPATAYPEGPDDDILYSLFGRFWQRRQTPTQEDVIEAWQAKSRERQEWPSGDYSIVRVPDNGLAVTYQIQDGETLIGHARLAPPSVRLALPIQEVARRAQESGGDVTPEQFQRARLAGEVTNVEIDEGYRRRGIGRRLYRAIDDDLKSIGAELFPSRTAMTEGGEALWLAFDPKRLVEFHRAEGVDTYDPRMVRAMQAAGMSDDGSLFALPPGRVVPLRSGVGQDAEIVTDRPAHARAFADARVVLDKAGGFSIDGLYDDYQQWSQETGAVPMPREAFGELIEPMLRDLGAESFMLAGKVRYPVMLRPRDELFALPRHVTESPEFRNWFGDSRVVDAEGRPLVVYHGTKSFEGDQFNVEKYGTGVGADGPVGFYFTSGAENANFYAQGFSEEITPDRAGMHVIPVYISAQNPLVIDYRNDWDDLVDALGFDSDFDAVGDSAEITRRAQAQGYDAIWRINRDDPDDGLDELIVFDPTQIKSAIGNRGQFDENDPRMLFTFAGERALVADRIKLEEAQTRLDRGEDANMVWTETGWWRGQDGLWRFELDDSNIAFKEGALQPETVTLRDGRSEIRFSYQGRLGDLIDAPNLFAAYPEMADYPTAIEPFPRGAASGWFNPFTKEIQTVSMNPDAMLNTLVHEIQHGIQTVEEFSNGGGHGTIYSRLSMSLFEVEYQLSRLSEGSNLSGELERIRQAITEQMEFVGVPDARRLTPPQYELYLRLFGEAEARNVSARRELGEVERRLTPPPETEDVPAEEQYGRVDLTSALPENYGLFETAIREEWTDAPELAKRVNGDGTVSYYSFSFDHISGNRARLPVSVTLAPDDMVRIGRLFGLQALRDAVQRNIDTETNYRQTAQERIDEGDMDPRVSALRDELDQVVGALSTTRDMLDTVLEKHPELGPKPSLSVAPIDPDNVIDPYDGPTFSQADIDDLTRAVTHRIEQLHADGAIDDDQLAAGVDELLMRGLYSFVNARTIHHTDRHEGTLAALEDADPDLMDRVYLALAYRQYIGHRSAIYNGLTRSLSPSTPLFHLPGFYSPAINFIRDARQERAPLKQWIGMLRKAPGVREEELDWMGIAQWQEGLSKKSVTRDELLEFMRAHQVELDERVLSGQPIREMEAEIREEAQRRYEDEVETRVNEIMQDVEEDLDTGFTVQQDEEGDWSYTLFYEDADEGSDTGFASEEEATGAAEEADTDLRDRIIEQERSRARLEAESAIDRDDIESDVRAEYEDDPDRPRWNKYKVAGGSDYTELLIRLPDLARQNYVSSHFDDQEVVHVRFDTRHIDGKRVLFINEVQSDLHQKGRTQGYRQTGDRERMDQLRDEFTEASIEENRAHSRRVGAEGPLENLIRSVIERGEYPFDLDPQNPDVSIRVLTQDLVGAIRGNAERSVEPQGGDAMADVPLPDGMHYILGQIEGAPELEQYRAAAAEYARLHRRSQDIQDEMGDLRRRMPVAPYKGDGWVEIALKRMLHYAAENGYDGISWARADQIAPMVDGNVEDLRMLYDKKIDRFYRKYTKKWGGEVERAGVVEWERRQDGLTGDDIAHIETQIMSAAGGARPDGSLDPYARTAILTLRQHRTDFDSLYAAAQNLEGRAGQMLRMALNPYRDKVEGKQYRYTSFGSIRERMASTARDVVDSIAADMIDVENDALNHTMRQELADALNAHVHAWEQGEAAPTPEADPIPNEAIANDLRRAADMLLERNEQPTNPVLWMNERIRESVRAGQPLAMRGGRGAEPLLNQQNIESFLDEWRQVVPPETTIRVQETLPMNALGAFKPSEDMILISSFASNPNAILRHEQIHALRNAGLFSAEEWKILTTTSRQHADQLRIEETYGETYRARFSPERAEEALAEEAVATMAQLREEGQSFGPETDSLLDRILRLMERLKNWALGRGFKAHTDILQDVATGRVARRAWEQKTDDARFAASTLAGQGQRQPGSPGPPPVIPGVSRDAMSLVDIQRELRRRLGLTTRRGRLNRRLISQAAQQRRRVAGQYDRHAEVIRLKVLEDIDTEAHEVGHALEDRLPGIQAIQQRHDTELLGIAALNGDNSLAEGFAEFFRLYLTNPQAAEQHAPDFLNDFETFLDGEAPRTLKDIQDIRDLYREWREAPSSSRLTAAVKSGIRPGIRERIQETYEREGMKGVGRGFWNTMNTVYKSTNDGTNPLRNWVEGVAQIADERNQDIDLAAWRNPHMQLANAGSFDAAAYMDATKGVAWEGRHGKGHVNLPDALRMAFDGQNHEDWSQEQRDAFGAYLLARRGRWLWPRFEMDQSKFLGRHNAPPQQAVSGEWYYDLQARKRRIMLNGRWEDELLRAPDKHSLGDHEQTLSDLEAANPQFERAAHMLYQFLRDLALKRYQAGLDSWEEYQYKVTTPDYVPWFRDMSDEIFAGTPLSGRKVAPKFKLRGSFRDFIDPVEGIIRQVYNTNREISINKPKQLMAKLVEQVEGAGAYGEIIPAQRMRIQEVRVRDVLERAGREAGMPPEDINQMISAHIALMGEDAVAKLFKPEEAPDAGDVVLHYMEGGQLKMLQVGDGDGKDLARQIFGIYQALGSNSMAADGFAHFVAAAVRVPQRGITTHPLFQIRNAIRDTYQSSVMMAGYFPIVSNIRTIIENERLRSRDMETWSDILARYQAIMGGLNQANVRELKGGQVEELRFGGGKTLRPWEWAFWTRRMNPLHSEFFGYSKAFWTRTMNPRHPDFWWWAEWTEANARQTLARIEFQRAFADAQAHYPNMPRDQQVFISLQQAAQQSRDYVDYNRTGDLPSWIAIQRLIMFLRPAIQGPDRMFRKLFLAQGVDGRFAAAQAVRKKLKPLFEAEGAPKKLSQREIQSLRDATRAWVTLAGIASVHLAIETLMNDEEDLEDRPELERALYVIFSIDGTEYRIPRGYDIVNLVSNGMRAMYESWFRDDPTARERFRRTLGPAVVPPTSSPLLDLYIAWYHQRDNFFDRAIVPEYMKGRLPEERYRAYTSKLSRDISEAVNPVTEPWGVEVSPLIVEYTMTSLGTDWARDILRTYDSTDPNKPELRWQDAPFLRGLTTSRSTRGTRDFWDLMGREGDFMQAAGSYKEEAVKNNRWRKDEIRDFFERRLQDDDARAWAIMYGHMDIGQRRLHPLQRAKTFVKSVRGIARDVSSDEVTDPNVGKQVDIDRGVRGELMTILDEISRREYRNALIAMNRPGYEGRTIQPVKPYLDELQGLSPETHAALMHEITFKDGTPKVYDFDYVRSKWPELKRRLLDPSIRERIVEAEGQVELDLFSGAAAAAQTTGLR